MVLGSFWNVVHVGQERRGEQRSIHRAGDQKTTGLCLSLTVRLGPSHPQPLDLSFTYNVPGVFQAGRKRKSYSFPWSLKGHEGDTLHTEEEM